MFIGRKWGLAYFLVLVQYAQIVSALRVFLKEGANIRYLLHIHNYGCLISPSWKTLRWKCSKGVECSLGVEVVLEKLEGFYFYVLLRARIFKGHQ